MTFFSVMTPALADATVKQISEVGVPALWWHDPRWWAIAVSLLIGSSNTVYQVFARRKDHRLKGRDERFDEAVGEPVTSTFASLRTIAAKANSAASQQTQDKVDEVLQELMIKDVPEAMGLLTGVCRQVDRVCARGDIFVTHAVQLEDKIYDLVDNLRTGTTVAERRDAARTTGKAIDDCIVGLTKELGAARDEFRKS